MAVLSTLLPRTPKARPYASGSCATGRHFHPDLTRATAISLLRYCRLPVEINDFQADGDRARCRLGVLPPGTSLVGSGAVSSHPPLSLLIILPLRPGISSTGGRYRPSGFHSIAQPAAIQTELNRTILLYHFRLSASDRAFYRIGAWSVRHFTP
jgi:hypothetical protein